MEEYESFHEQETAGNVGRQRTPMTEKEAKKMEYEALGRQRRLKAEKYNERKKAALKRKECVCLLEQREKDTMMGVVMGTVFF